VAHIALWVCNQREWGEHINVAETENQVLRYALLHDETEALTGDIPATVARGPLPRKTSEYEEQSGQGASGAPADIRQILKIADLLEAFLFVKEEELLGNKSLDIINGHIKGRLRDVCADFPMKNPPLNQAKSFYADYLIADFLRAYQPERHPDNED
jgi:5'-deoxynucleotidase YfbR-like HD superfamily hydrolase